MDFLVLQRMMNFAPWPIESTPAGFALSSLPKLLNNCQLSELIEQYDKTFSGYHRRKLFRHKSFLPSSGNDGA